MEEQPIFTKEIDTLGRAKITEDLFKSNFLEYLITECDDPEHKRDQWAAMVGGFYKEADLIMNDGRTLVVPQMYPTIHMDYDSKDVLSENIVSAKLEEDVSPTDGEIAAVKLSNKLDTSFDQEWIKSWANIARELGYEVEGEVEPKDTENYAVY